MLPEAVRTRPKQGFEMPVDAWLRGPLRDVVEAAVLSPGARVAGLVDQEAARALYQAHRAGTGDCQRSFLAHWHHAVLARIHAAPALAPP